VPNRPAAPGLEISDNRITRTIVEGVQIIPGGIDSASGQPNYYDHLTIRRNVVSDFRLLDGVKYSGAAFALEIIGNLATNVVIENNKVRGAVLYGDVRDGPWYLELMSEGRDVRALRDNLLFGSTKGK